MFQRKLNTVSSKARMKFSNKKMEPLGLLGKSPARLSRECLFQSNRTVALEVYQKGHTWRYEYENTNRIMGLMHKAAPFP